MVWAAYKATHFFKHESCGKCTPCREGTFWLDKLLYRLVDGQGTEADIKLIESVAANMKGKCLCALGEFAISPAQSMIKHFLPEFQARVRRPDPVAAD